MNKFFNKLRYRAYRKGFTDGHRWAWKRLQDHTTHVDDFFNPPIWFSGWYAFGFDSGAGLEID